MAGLPSQSALFGPSHHDKRSAMAVLHTAFLFDNPEYADIIVSYSGRKTFCHKIILCTSSEYFKKLCGPGSHFAESKQDTIELKEDDPDAVYQLLKYVYTKNSHCGDREGDYALQLEVAKVAQKYLYPNLYKAAMAQFRTLVTAMKNPERIFDSLTHIRGASDDDEVLKLADEVQNRHILPLMKVPGFRECVDQDREMMWKLLDDFIDFKSGLQEMVFICCSNCKANRLFLAESDEAKKMGTHRGCPSFSCFVKMHCWVAQSSAAVFLSEVNREKAQLTASSISC